MTVEMDRTPVALQSPADVVLVAPHPPAGTFSPQDGEKETSGTAAAIPLPASGRPKDGQRHAALPRQVRVRGKG